VTSEKSKVEWVAAGQIPVWSKVYVDPTDRHGESRRENESTLVNEQPQMQPSTKSTTVPHLDACQSHWECQCARSATQASNMISKPGLE